MDNLRLPVGDGCVDGFSTDESAIETVGCPEHKRSRHPVVDRQQAPQRQFCWTNCTVQLRQGVLLRAGRLYFGTISQESGLASWHHRMGNPQKDFILDAIGSGVALLDYDNDGGGSTFI